MHVHTRVRAAVRHYHTYAHGCGFNIPLTTGCYILRCYNQIICLLGGVCSNMSPQSHKAINLFCRRCQESPFSLRLIYFSCNLTLLSMPTNPLLCLQTVRAHAVTESEMEYQSKKKNKKNTIICLFMTNSKDGSTVQTHLCTSTH